MDSIYTVATERGLPKTMGSYDILFAPEIIEVFKNAAQLAGVRKRYMTPIVMYRWKNIDGILHQESEWQIE